MSAPLTHATVWGLAMLRGEPESADAGLRRACNNTDSPGILLFGKLRDTIPTCPECAVLRDAALENQTQEDK